MPKTKEKNLEGKKYVYEMISEKIIEQLEDGVIP